MKKTKIAIIGASYLQLPLILKAKELGFETHVFAWKCGDVGENEADYFYPISIVEKDVILEKCKELAIDGVCTIASDLANITVAYVAEHMGLCANSIATVAKTTDKALMREELKKHDDPSPNYLLFPKAELRDIDNLNLPIIVKPKDRSGSRGVTKLNHLTLIGDALRRAYEESFSGDAIVEEYVSGKEYSVETISWEGEHQVIAITEKFTTGSPNFIEVAHLEPARLDEELIGKVQSIVIKALSDLGVMYGASHSEIMIDSDRNVWIIEIGSRMGGDLIGSHLVELSTGYDYVKAVLYVALNQKPMEPPLGNIKNALVHYFFDKKDIDEYISVIHERPELIAFATPIEGAPDIIADSSARLGCFVLASDALTDIVPFLPE